MDQEHAARLGAYLKKKREAAGLSTRYIAGVAGVAQPQITRLEQGAVAYPRADVLGKIANALGLQPADLLKRAGYPTGTTLPELRPYMRAKYAQLPPEAIAEVEAFIDDLTSRYPNGGPAEGADEH